MAFLSHLNSNPEHELGITRIIIRRVHADENMQIARSEETRQSNRSRELQRSAKQRPDCASGG